MPSLRPNANRVKKAAIDEGKKIFKEKQLHIWYEIVQALDKKSVFFRPTNLFRTSNLEKKDRNETVIVYLIEQRIFSIT